MDGVDCAREQETTYGLTSCAIKIKDVGRMGSNGQSSFLEKFVDGYQTIWENIRRKY
jgi:hypothetical protein